MGPVRKTGVLFSLSSVNLASHITVLVAVFLPLNRGLLIGKVESKARLNVVCLQVTQETTGQQVRSGLQCLAELMPRPLCFLSGRMTLEAAITQILGAMTILSFTAQISESHYYLLNCKILTAG